VEIFSRLDTINENIRANVIVIDDDRDTVSALSDFLEIKGLKVIGKGYDGLEAVELYKKLKPDIVFLDVMMDNFDGLYALEKIKKIQPDAVVIMVTADLNEKTTNQLSELRASATIYKPYDINEIMSVLHKLYILRLT